MNGRTDYFLKISMMVPDEKLALFEERAAAILDPFEKLTKFTLKAAGRRELKTLSGASDWEYDERQRFRGSQHQDWRNKKHHEIFHLWDIHQADDVLVAMMKLVDFPAYMAMDRDLVRDDVQNVVVLVPGVGLLAQPSGGRKRNPVKRYMRITNRIRKHFLDEFMAQHEESLRGRVELKSGIRSVGCFLNITGPLNEVVELWELPDVDMDKEKPSWPGRSTVERFKEDILHVMSYDPVMRSEL